jgi:hypothetical protein
MATRVPCERDDVTPMLLDELELHRFDSERAGSDDLVFGTSRGTRRNSNVTPLILQLPRLRH